MNIREDDSENTLDAAEEPEKEPRMGPTHRALPDELDLWICRHGDRIRSAVCTTPEFETSPFCKKE